MVYEIKRPYVEIPYTIVILDFSDVGVKRLFDYIGLCDDFVEDKFEEILFELLVGESWNLHESYNIRSCDEGNIYRAWAEDIILEMDFIGRRELVGR